jgi:hypothetical protein
MDVTNTEIFTVLVMTSQHFQFGTLLPNWKIRAGITKIIAFEQKYSNIYSSTTEVTLVAMSRLVTTTATRRRAAWPLEEVPSEASAAAEAMSPL